LVRVAQLSAVVIALVLVVGAAGFGITKGFLTESDHFASVCRLRDVRWIPVISQVALPSLLPEGVSLTTACYSTGDIALWYGNEENNKVLLVSFVANQFSRDSAPTGDVPIKLGDLLGYVTDTTNPDGTRFHDVTFVRRGWVHSVGAYIGKNPGHPDNTVTPDELKAVALSMAEQ
jgi:hypothetical protein